MQAFSVMGWIHSKQRNKLLPGTTEMVTAIKMHYDSFAPVTLSSTQQAKRARFDAAVSSSICVGDSLAGAAELPAGLVDQIAANRGAAAAAAATGEQGEHEHLEDLGAADLQEQLERVRLHIQTQTVTPPAGFATWTEAVEDAAGSGWDFELNLTDPNYTEVYTAPVVALRAPTTGQFDPAALVQQDLEQVQQCFATQQQLMQGFQQAGMADLATSLHQHMQQQYMQL
jgi:hypothetical protein